MAKHNELGSLGEEIVEKALLNKGFSLLARNYRKKWGELDIVVHKDKVVHIIEVKTVTRRSIKGKFLEYKDQYRPEDNLHPNKQKRLKRAINSFFLEKFKGYPTKWQFDLACVYIDPVSKISKIVYSDNIIL